MFLQAGFGVRMQARQSLKERLLEGCTLPGSEMVPIEHGRSLFVVGKA
jgi:hypothetical protein